MGSLTRVRELATSLSNLGHEIHVLTPFKERIDWSPQIKTHYIHSPSGFFAKRLYPYLRRILNHSILARYLFLKPAFLEKGVTSLANSTLRTIKDRNLDLDIIQGEQEIAALALVQMKEKISTPISADLHNIWVEELAVKNIMGRNSNVYARLQELENRIAAFSDAYIVVSDAMMDYVKKRYSITGETKVVPPGGRVRTEEVLRRDEPPKVVYAGLVAHREHVDLFVKSMPEIRKRFSNAEFFITNKGEELRSIRRLCRRLKVAPRLFWFRESKDFFRFLGKCHVGVLPSSDDIARKMGTPVKLFDYLSVGVPVVANNIGSWCEIISRYKTGILTEGNPSAFGEGIAELLDCRDRIEEFGKRGLELIRTKYNWDNSAKCLLDVYKRLA
jgi:glycosyltransferase involved in cell wall biosynthesis